MTIPLWLLAGLLLAAFVAGLLLGAAVLSWLAMSKIADAQAGEFDGRL